jgi:hypothetical protein
MDELSSDKHYFAKSTFILFHFWPRTAQLDCFLSCFLDLSAPTDKCSLAKSDNNGPVQNESGTIATSDVHGPSRAGPGFSPKKSPARSMKREEKALAHYNLAH